MKKYSFKQYIGKNYDNELFETVATYIPERLSDIHLLIKSQFMKNDLR